MDWCDTDVNGTQLNPKIQYPEMVRIIIIHTYISTCTYIS